eukprot:m.143977 g.143977  ORF g.143977 m.143977 type:complete len:1013 (-) comp30346_c0_seq1:516-3554(-)
MPAMVVKFIGALSLLNVALAMDVVPFKYGWRFHYGPGPDDAPGPGNCVYETDVATAQCTGLEHNPNRFTPDDCRIGCCYEPTCFVWQNNGRSCQWGNASSVCTGGGGKSTTQFGGQRKEFQPVKTDYQFATDSFDDSDWMQVDVPYDSLVNGTFTDTGDVHHGFLPRNVSWFRKKFSLPQDDAVWMLEFESTFHYTQIYVNGVHVLDHSLGYTPYSIRLDNLSNINRGGANTIALRTDASYGSGHWYEGGGIRWDVNLVRYNTTHIPRFGAFVVPQVDSAMPANGIPCSVEVVSDASVNVLAVFEISAQGSSAGTCSAKGQTNANGEMSMLKCGLHPLAPLKLWGVQAPTLYTVTVTVYVVASDGSNTSADARSWSTGFRTAEFSGDSGLKLNGDHVKYRGFSHHDSFGGVGTAMPPRFDLFRAQASKMMGSNVWRMSHNPYHQPLYSILDALGTTIWDENRDLGPWYAFGMKEMVRRDRNHPSVLLWSFCNEFECGQNSPDTGYAFRAATLSEDTSRPTTSNINGAIITGVDVQGFSHASAPKITAFHEASPKVPTVLSECCSCTSHRLPVSDRGPSSSCIRQQNSPGLLNFTTGSLGVWTLFDYFGESHNWPDYACAFGQFDIAGSPKPHAYWYLVNWLQLMDKSDPGRPNVPASPVARVLDLADQLDCTNGICSISGIATTPKSELFVNGKSQGVQTPTQLGDVIVWKVGKQLLHSEAATCNFTVNVSVQCKGLTSAKSATTAEECAAYACNNNDNVWQFSNDHGCWTGAGVNIKDCAFNPKQPDWVGAGNAPSPDPNNIDNVTLHALNTDGSVVTSHTISASRTGVGAALTATFDVPSLATGTGTKLVLDGTDTGLVRITLVDAAGRLVSTDTAAVNVTFTVISGPGRIVGSVSGDPAAHEPQRGATVATYAGTAKALVQVSVDCTSPNRDMAMKIDLDSKRTTIVPSSNSCAQYTQTPIVVQATSGSMSVQVSVAVSDNVAVDGWLAIAQTTGSNLTGYTYLTDFAG